MSTETPVKSGPVGPLVRVASLFALAACQIAAAQTDVSALVARLGPSIVLIRTFDANGRALQQGSGFLLDDGRIVTNTHVIRGAANAEIVDANGRLLGATQYAEVLSNSADLAILPAVRTDLPGLSLETEEPLVGTSILVIGAPEGLQNTVSDGIVSAVRTIDSRRLIQISAAISRGSSGGPVVDLNGRVVGVAVSSILEGQNLNFAIPADSVQVLVTSPPGQIAFGTITTIPGEPATGRELPFDEPVSSDLHDGLPQLSDGSYYETWNFEGDQGQRIRIRMSSEAFDTFLILGRMVNDRFVTLIINDDRLFNRDSRLNFTLPATGQYILYATSFYGGSVGAYTLLLEAR